MTLAFTLFVLVLQSTWLCQGSPLYQPIFVDNPSTGANSKDAAFQALCDQPYPGANQGTNCESWGFEVSFNSGQEARVNALTGEKPFGAPPYGGGNPNPFSFSVASTNINGSGVWVPGRTYRFSQSYSGDASAQSGPPVYVNTGGTLAIMVTDPGADGLFNGINDVTHTINYQPRYGEVRALLVRMVAGDPDATNRPTQQSLTFTNWTLGGSSIAGMPASVQLATSDTPGVDDTRLLRYFQISGIDFTQAWKLTGDFTLDWSGGTLLPENNGLAFQIKHFTVSAADVPEPGSTALIGGGLLLLCAARRCKRRG